MGCRVPVDDLDGPPTAVALVQQGVVALRELVLLPEGTQGEQALQALIEVAEDRGQGQAVQALQLSGGGNIVHLLRVSKDVVQVLECAYGMGQTESAALLDLGMQWNVYMGNFQ